MKTRIYEIKGGAVGNAEILRGREESRFFWNDEKFKEFQVGDHIFFVNKPKSWVLFTVIGEKDINATWTEQDQKSTFTYNGHMYSVDDPTGRFKRFVRFDILQQATITKSNTWTGLGSSEVNDLWLNGNQIKASQTRLDRVQQLKAMFKTGIAYDHLVDIEGKLSSGAQTNKVKPTEPSGMSTMKFSDEHRSVLCAIKTKPFVLLAGISGTGKSRLVRTLAYQTCPEGELRNTHRPGNYALIMVKPNWHDPTELIGYVSRIGEKPRYVVTEFLRFVVKAWQYPDVPFFLCLDEMNLAPVEQYFADFLSVVETRRMGDDGTVISDAILTSQNADSPAVFGAALDELGLNGSTELRQRFLDEGITLPPNLVVMGTVNMDETTHSFSRKVLDRAMTFEMNEVDLRAGLGDNDGDWSYPDAPITSTGVKLTRGGDVPDFVGYETVLEWLEQMNGVLNGTPFKVAYRVRDEYLLYAYHNSLLANKPEGWLARCMDELLVMKVLSRIEGDEGRVGVVLKNLIALVPDSWVLSKKKLEEMQGKLAYGYTSFWS